MMLIVLSRKGPGRRRFGTHLKMNRTRPGVVEGKDYTIEEGLYVWTARFLKERGYCCGNGCRHCPYDFVNDKKVISLVPSWTDTLINSDINVVGRTKFCIQPENKVKDIPILGGTKDLKTEKLRNIEADLVILDKQENPKEFIDEINKPYYASDIRSLSGLFEEMVKLNRLLNNKKINEQIIRLERILEKRPVHRSLSSLPGVIEWIKPINKQIDQVLYMIWRKPWMCVSSNTFIASMFEHLGYVKLFPEFTDDYPEVSLQDYDKQHTLLLFSSEPFPFHKKTDELKDLGFQSAVVDGQAYSWFGSSAIDFLEKNMND